MTWKMLMFFFGPQPRQKQYEASSKTGLLLLTWIDHNHSLEK